MSVNQLLVLSTNTIIFFSALGLLILSTVLLLECICALFPVSSFNDSKNQDIKVTVIVPAHNEEAIIRSTLIEIKSQLKNQNLLVIADNCTDRTAEIARKIGATVIERYDVQKIGKGYALDYGLQFLASDPPDVVVCIDADCKVDQGAIEQLSQLAMKTKRPVQATYLMAKYGESSLKQSVSAFAFKIKNLVRFLGLARLGVPCLLTGTGMAFPWSVISYVNLASGNIVEDMKLGLDLTIAGYPPIFYPEANVIGYLPQELHTAKNQRTRWEHGHLKTLITYVPILIKESINQKRFSLIFSALDLCIPPLSLLVVIWLGLILSSFAATFFGASLISLLLLNISGCLIFIAIFTAWIKFGRNDLPLFELLSIPFYILWKIPLYFQFVRQPENTWTRTKREI